MSGHPENAGLGAMLASRRQTQTCAIWRAADDGSGLALHESGVACKVYVPGNPRALETLAELGGARASHAGELPLGADVLEGDELRIPPRAYVVQRAIGRDTLTWCALEWLAGVIVEDESGDSLAGYATGMDWPFTYAE